jgi:hypothetical protein
MKCELGPKKVRRLEALLGCKVVVAYVRGGWPHGWARVVLDGDPPGTNRPLVNYHTGEWDSPWPETTLPYDVFVKQRAAAEEAAAP